MPYNLRQFRKGFQELASEIGNQLEQSVHLVESAGSLLRSEASMQELGVVADQMRDLKQACRDQILRLVHLSVVG